MGLKPSPYQACQGALWLKRKALGEPSDETNVFAWDRVKVNVPGSTTYRPGRPWISKRRVDGLIALDIHVYVDDGRSRAPRRRIDVASKQSLRQDSVTLGTAGHAAKTTTAKSTTGSVVGAVRGNDGYPSAGVGFTGSM
jgi:hypothetical protein